MSNDSDEFRRGYLDGWQTIKRGSHPPGIPAFAIPAGKTAYQHGRELGEAKARSRS